jgi:hypothetical protein
LGDFYLSVEIKQASGPDSADYGVVFREDADANFYYFGINEQGQYALYLYNPRLEHPSSIGPRAI